MIRHLLVMSCALTLPMSALAEQPSVRLEPLQLRGSRPMEKQTETAVIRDYLEAWKSLRAAFDQNQASLLDTYFVGTAREKLANTIGDQAKLGVHTRYIERTHDLQIVFYSPEGLSIQMTDNVEYEEQVLDHDKVLATKPIRIRYLVVLAPAEVRWRVRIFQGEVGSDSL
jgi:hypothetical protein